MMHSSIALVGSSLGFRNKSGSALETASTVSRVSDTAFSVGLDA